MAKMDEMRVSLSPRLSAVRSLAQMVEEFGDANQLPELKIYMVNLALDELITNAVTYGFERIAYPKIEVTVRVTDTTLVLTMVDNGTKFDPTVDSNPDVSSGIEERAVGGLGLHLVKTSADRVSYEFVGGKNRVTLEHDLTPVGG
jgi:anti-sigma regulatory factor (Ser/Thr protein kinase)